jgi:hypothetical protein
MTAKNIHYRFGRPGEARQQLTVAIDGASLICNEPAPVACEWTALSFQQCPNCPLDAAATPLCPLAARLEPVVRPMAEILSFAELAVEVDDGERTVSAVTSAQAVASSLIGLIAAVSGCPHTAFLRTMAWFHLPLATEEETVFRATGAYLLAQRIALERGETPDWEMLGLKRDYEALHVVNVALARRLRAAVSQDAAVNAIVRLDMFAKAVPYSIDDFLEPLRPRFPPP